MSSRKRLFLELLMKRLLKHVKNNLFWYLLLLVILSAVFAPILLIAFLLIGVVILFAKKFTTEPSNDSHDVSYGKRGGRYTEDVTKDGRPYRRYF